MPITDEAIATSAQGELPETWEKLANAKSFGNSLLQKHTEAIHKYLFGDVLTQAEQEALDVRVVDYAGKLLALRLIRPAIDYWSKQTISVTTGENDQKSWNDRAQALNDLKKDLLEETRQMMPDVEALLPERLIKKARGVPLVEDLPLEAAHTPDPLDFEAPFGPPTQVPGT